MWNSKFRPDLAVGSQRIEHTDITGTRYQDYKVKYESTPKNPKNKNATKTQKH